MDDASSETVTRIITAANHHFKVPLCNEKLIKHCLQHPDFHMSRPLGKNLKLLLMKIRQNAHASNNKHFYKNIRSILKDAIDNLSGIRKQIRPQNPIVPRAIKKTSSIKDVRQVLKIVELHCPVPFWFAAPALFDRRTIKLSEGSFGEIYRMTHSDGEKRILKVIPIEGITLPDNEPQLTFREINPEVATSLTLAKLAFGVRNRCSAFPNIYKVCVVQDSFPKPAIVSWKRYAKEKNTSFHTRPDKYSSDQAYITIESNDGGVELDIFEIKSFLQAVSIFQQVATAVAIAEEAHQFEHRDLHSGNILLKKCNEKELHVKFRNRDIQIETHGIKAMIIDFTYSRIATEDGVQYLKLDDIYDIETACSNGFRDHHYVYRKMREATNGKWNEFHPETNVFWFKHITENLLFKMRRISKIALKGCQRSLLENIAMKTLHMYDRTCLSFESAAQFVQECILC